jgi:hypothetical protein
MRPLEHFERWSGIEGNSSFETSARFAMMPHLAETLKHGAATSAKLRILRQGFTACVDGRAHLQL